MTTGGEKTMNHWPVVYSKGVNSVRLIRVRGGKMKKTKIVATISHMNCSEDFIRALWSAGMNVVRLNSAHQSFEGALEIVRCVRAVSDRIAILMDTKGPQIRTLPMEKPFAVVKDQLVKICGEGKCKNPSECISVNHPGFVGNVPVGSRILIDDGAVELSVIEVDGDALQCRVMNTGEIKGRKSVNVPNVPVDLPSVSERDKQYINFAVENNLDFIAHSFVRDRADVEAVQSILDNLGSAMKIIAKIENQSGVDSIDEILDVAYGVMVARGDLAIEIPFEKVPGVQKMLINKCVERRKPVVVATQMLHSMIDNPRPTRAEVNDVAGAIYDQADAVMLSGETAIGAYPVESVKLMAAIAKEVEESEDKLNDIPIVVINNAVSAYLIKAAVEGAVDLDAKSIIADTTSGRTIRSLAAYRGNRTINAQCYLKSTMRHLALSYGVHARYMEAGHLNHDFVGNALHQLRSEGIFSDQDRVVIVAGNFGRSRGVSFVEIGTVDNLIDAGGQI